MAKTKTKANELQKLTARELANIKQLVAGDRKLSAAFTLAARLAKTDSGWRGKCNAIARDFVANRRALGMALEPAIPRKGGRPGKNLATVAKLNIDHYVSKNSRIIASIPEKALATMLDAMAKKDVIQVTPLYNYNRKMKEEAQEKEREENQKLVDQVQDPRELVGKNLVSTIIIDPPWDFSEEGDVNVYGRTRPDYAQMSDEDIGALPLAELAAKDCHLYLWITNRSLLTGKGWRLCEEWGFRPITIITWCKPSIGVGNYFRNNTEHVVFAVRGSLSLKVANVGTWFEADRGEGGHSGKPDEFLDMVLEWSHTPLIDMFSRKKSEHPGVISWGVTDS